jgi:hypothetical protein
LQGSRQHCLPCCQNIHCSQTVYAAACCSSCCWCRHAAASGAPNNLPLCQDLANVTRKQSFAALKSLITMGCCAVT